VALFIIEEYDRVPDPDPNEVSRWVMEMMERDWREHHP
jgi:hypothetical protein